MKTQFAITAVLALCILVPAAPARADIVLTPYVGSFFGGDISGKPAAYGASAAFMGGGIFGGEVGFNYAPKFISAGVGNPDIAQMSLMGNLIVGIPIGDDDQAGHVRPYVTGGAGLFRVSSKESQFFNHVSSNDFAVNFGGGVMAFFNENVGIRGDVRYFRTVNDNNPGSGLDFDLGTQRFWKWDIGAAFKF
ncbi:MAG: outer membrane beta-barrel protein [Vicinamibacterales bacterium]